MARLSIRHHGDFNFTENGFELAEREPERALDPVLRARRQNDIARADFEPAAGAISGGNDYRAGEPVLGSSGRRRSVFRNAEFWWFADKLDYSLCGHNVLR